jgi:oligopeptide transport system ATP-binding protein
MSEPILRVEHLAKYFDAQEHIIARSRANVKAVDDISFSVPKGSVFGLVGESGCGKSTTARLILKLLNPTNGKVFFDEKDVFTLKPGELQKMRRDIQMIFQDPYSSLNPRWRIGQILEARNADKWSSGFWRLLDCVRKTPKNMPMSSVAVNVSVSE